jgi:hypothetical protein
MKINLLTVAIILASCLFGQQASAQERFRGPRKFFVEPGINTTTLLDKILKRTSDSTSFNSNPYLLSLRLCRGPIGLRMAGGGTYKKEVAKERGFLDSGSNLNQETNLRVGLDYRMPVSRRFSVALGADALWDFSKKESLLDSGFDVLRQIDQRETWGGGPTIGLYFWASPKFALYTECAIYFSSGIAERGRFFQNFPELNDNVQDIEVSELKTVAPTNLFLVFRF